MSEFLDKPVFKEGLTASKAITVNSDVVAQYVQSAYGADMGGFAITGVAAPSDPTDAANRQYVDDHSTGFVPDEVHIGSTPPVDPTVEYWIDPAGVAGEAGIDYLPTSGGTVTGSVTVQGDTIATWVSASLGADMGGYPITNVADPVDGGDAVNRQWIETRSAPVLVLGASDPVPPETLAGTVIIRTA